MPAFFTGTPTRPDSPLTVNDVEARVYRLIPLLYLGVAAQEYWFGDTGLEQFRAFSAQRFHVKSDGSPYFSTTFGGPNGGASRPGLRPSSPRVRVVNIDTVNWSAVQQEW